MSETEWKVLVDSYGADSALVALAELASPACRIEPQLLRRLRLACVPDADVSVEQELWHSELVNSRGETITFREGVTRELRTRLQARQKAQPEVVERAREVMAEAHAELSPLLILEDELAWAEVFEDARSIGEGAATLLHALLARRDGLDYWLGRAWGVLPDSLKALPQGRELAQVAAARGARIDDDPGATAAGKAVAHVLPLSPLPLRLDGLTLVVNVRPSEATHVIDVPQTRPRALSVTSPAGTEELVFGVAETKSVHVGAGVVVLRTVTGAEYEIQAAGGTGTVLEIELLAAGHSTSLIIRYGDGPSCRRMLVDCGNRRTGNALVERFKRPGGLDEPIELLVLTHIDDGHIGGAIPLLESGVLDRQLRDVWFNASRQLKPMGEAPS